MDLTSFYYFGGSLAFDNLNFWAFVLIVTAVFIALLIANTLIQCIKPLRKALIPSPVLGGFLLLLVLSVYKAIAGKPLFNPFILEMITYHCLGLGFVAVSMKSKKKIKGKSAQKGIFDSSLVTVTTYLLQGIVGLLISVILFYVVHSWPASGVLVPMGYGQGPGQAMNWGKTYMENANNFSAFGPFEGGTSFGLTIAAMGFVSASIGGLIYLNRERKKGNIKFVEHSSDLEDEHLTVKSFTDENEIPNSKSVDKLSVQLGLVLVAYAMSFALIYGISVGCDKSGVNLLINTIKPLFWGFNFIIGTAMAVLLKAILSALAKKGVVKKQYTNNFLLDRISGVCFDVMVVAAIAAIDLSAFGKKEFILPLVLMCIAAAVSTFFYNKHVCRVLFEKDGYFEEAFLCMYGMLTGTASTGIILLREIDPEFKTPASTNMVYQTLWSILLGAPVLLLMSFVATDMTKLFIGLAIYVVLFIALYLVIRRESILKRLRKKTPFEGIPDEDVTSDATDDVTAEITE